MSLQFATTIRTPMLDLIESDTGTSAIMKIRTGAAPANCGTADSGTALATINLPSDWMAAASSGTKAKLGTWEDTAADAAGVAAHFRIYKSDGVTCQVQGTVGMGSGDLQLDNTNLAVGQDVVITNFTMTAPGA